MAWCRTSPVALFAAMSAAIAVAPSVAGQPATSAVADSVGAAPASTTTAIAAFPDLPLERPAPPVDPALGLLDTDPYEAELTAIKITRNLYGGDPLLDNPYSDAARLANPYSDALRVASPSTNPSGAYGNALLDENPYR